VEFEPRDRVRGKSVEGSVIETHGSIETKILVGSLQIAFRFQLGVGRLTCGETEFWGETFLSKCKPKYVTRVGPYP